MCSPDIRVIGTQPASCFAFALYGTLFHAVSKIGKLPSTAPVGKVGWKCAPPITPQPGIRELWRVKRMDRKRLGGMRKRRRAVVVVVLILLEQ